MSRLPLVIRKPVEAQPGCAVVAMTDDPTALRRRCSSAVNSRTAVDAAPDYRARIRSLARAYLDS
ncbi:hypothetical protein DFR75_104484 [Nocardia ignorata]|uniref:Uncharacterized protein n=2 Tax=Nocardia ignorata TaxID=145285 RepID=A0A4R6PK73_NOCIG|nr:hypothetical protein DFR75_104484 [Nocardia ignorata]